MKITLNNRLGVLLQESKIKTATGFARAMTARGYKLSTSQAARYINEVPPPAMTLHFIETACNLFQCLPGEFFDILITLEPDEAINPLLAIPQNAKRLVAQPQSPMQSAAATPEQLATPVRSKLPWEDSFGIAGPTVKPLPKPKSSK